MHRGAMTLTNVAYNPAFTWASDSVVTLERQMEQPLFNEHPLEMGLKRDDRALLEWLGQQENYAAAFRQSFPQEAAPITIANVIKAIATFERTLISGRSPFDRYVYDDDRAAFSEGARRGMRLFYSDRSGCANCHFGLNFSGPMVHRGKPEQRALFANNGSAVKGDEGLSVETKREQDRGPLQSADIAQHRADRAVHARRAVRDAGASDRALRRRRASTRSRSASWIRRSARSSLTAEEKRDLVEFLQNLTDPEFARRLRSPATRSLAASSVFAARRRRHVRRTASAP